MAVACGGCDSGRQTTTRSTPPPQKKEAGVFEPAVPSRDGDRFAVVRRFENRSFLEVGPADRSRLRTVYSSSPGLCCGNVAWAGRWLLVFEGPGGIATLDVKSGRLHTISHFVNFQLSQDGRQVAGWTEASESYPGTVGVISIKGTDCREVPRPSNASDSLAFFSQDGEAPLVLARAVRPRPGHRRARRRGHRAGLEPASVQGLLTRGVRISPVCASVA